MELGTVLPIRHHTVRECERGNGQCTLGKGWLRRFVRGVPVGTPGLGRELADHVGDLSAVRAHAKTRSVAGGVEKITISEAAYARLERALASVIPGPEDWRRGQESMYRRGGG